MRHITVRTIAIAVFISVAVLIGWLQLPTLIEQSVSSQSRQAFDNESATLIRAIGGLGLSSNPDIKVQCYGENMTPFHTDSGCEKFALYDYHFSALTPDEQSALPANASKLDTLLKQQGWTVDRPQDNIPSVSALYEKALNGGNGSVPMHKNVGPISCNLTIGMEGPSMTNRLVEGAVIVNVNEFSCSQHIGYMYPNLRRHHYNGV